LRRAIASSSLRERSSERAFQAAYSSGVHFLFFPTVFPQQIDDVLRLRTDVEEHLHDKRRVVESLFCHGYIVAVRDDPRKRLEETRLSRTRLDFRLV